jgi:hypothetical protein
LSENTILLTGVARSGTTLVCELLNQLPETVALDEPMDMAFLTEPPGHAATCERIAGFLDEMRESIITRGTAISWQVNGRVSAGKFADEYDDAGVRAELHSRAEIQIEKPLSRGFLLVAKHPASFTALLEALSQRFEVYAVIRNPLAVLSSWQTIPFRIRDGRHFTAERIDPGLAEGLAGLEDRLDRQFYLLSWFFEKYRTTLPESRIIRYESIVRSPGNALSVMTERAQAIDQPLENRNRSAIYDRRDMRLLGERLLRTDGPYWSFYTKESVEELLD